MNSVQIVQGNLSLISHQEAFIELLDAYVSDEMGSGKRFDLSLRDDVIKGLKENPCAVILFAEIESKLVGMSVCFKGFSTFQAKKLVNIHDLIVLPSYRNKGVAKNLLESVGKYARENNCCKITLEVREDNHSAMKLYRKIGFGEMKPPMDFWCKQLI